MASSEKVAFALMGPSFVASMVPVLMAAKDLDGPGMDLTTIRRSEIMLGGLSLSVGLVAAVAAGSPLPLVLTAATLAAVLFHYEQAMNSAGPRAVVLTGGGDDPEEDQ